MSTDDSEGSIRLFAIDRRAWAKACELGINTAVAYMVLACGTGGDNRTTAWSVQAIEKRTNVSRSQAKAAIKTLIDSGLVRLDQGGARPRYYLMPVDEIPENDNAPAALTSQEQLVLDVIRSAESSTAWVPKVGRFDSDWPRGNPYKIAVDLVRKGMLDDLGNQWFKVREAVEESDPTKPDWIWFPGSVVEGAADETPPIELIRQSQNVAALRLFGELYHAQRLAEFGGVHWREVRLDFERHRVGDYGPYVVWGFTQGTNTAWPDAPFVHLTGKKEAVGEEGKQRDTGWKVFWEALGILTSLGVVETVGHLVEADTKEAGVIHPFPCQTGRGGERWEIDLYLAAHDAGMAMLSPAKQEWARNEGLALVPVRRHIGEVQVVGLLRTRYTADTKATSQWLEKVPTWEKMTALYRQEEERASAPLQHQGSIKV